MAAMNPLDLTPEQFKRAASIKEQIDRLNKELAGIFKDSASSQSTSVKMRTMSAAARRKIAAIQKARWAKFRDAKSAKRSAQSTMTAKKKRMSSVARAKLSAKLKAYWRAKKSSKK